MSQYSLLNELERKVILFNYEKRGWENSSLSLARLSDDDRSFILTEGDFILWELGKRKLLVDEVIAHSWVIMSKQNMPLVLQFKENNYLQVGSLFDQEIFDGVWRLEHGILRVFFNYQQNRFNIDVIANNKCAIHSALQVTDDLNVELLKVIPLCNAKYGTSLTG